MCTSVYCGPQTVASGPIHSKKTLKGCRKKFENKFPRHAIDLFHVESGNEGVGVGLIRKW
jgi:hypothetical protein